MAGVNSMEQALVEVVEALIQRGAIACLKSDREMKTML